MMLRSDDMRVGIVAPVGQDATVMQSLLEQHEVPAEVYENLSEVFTMAPDKVGALLFTEEALELPRLGEFHDWLQTQPSWSELPLIVLADRGESRVQKLLDFTATAAGSLILLERPIGLGTLLRSVEVALRSRRRQHEVRDLVEKLKHQQLALSESEESYRTLVSQVKDYAIFRTDMEGRPTSWNDGVRRVLGFEQDEFLGRDISQMIFTPEDVARGIPWKELREAAETGTANNDRWMRRQDGARFFAAGVTTCLRNRDGKPVGFTKVVRDVTEQRIAHEDLAEARGKLERHAAELETLVAERTCELRASNEQLEAFVYSIAHDLRAPLRSMLGYSQLLLDEHLHALGDNAQNLLKRIQASAEFMDRLLLDLLAYGRTAKAEMELAPVDLLEAWKTAIFQHAVQIDQSRAVIETEEPLPVVLAHDLTLTQCLANLLNNALKFVAPEVTPIVRLWAEKRGDFWRMWVEDNGVGIAPEHHERVFRVFERLHGARFPGTGIGLSIVRKGIERMGGQMGMESLPGQGSRFWIELRSADGLSRPQAAVGSAILDR